MLNKVCHELIEFRASLEISRDFEKFKSLSDEDKEAYQNQVFEAELDKMQKELDQATASLMAAHSQPPQMNTSSDQEELKEDVEFEGEEL